MDRLRMFARQPAMLSEVLQRVQENGGQVGPADPEDVRTALESFDPLWTQFTRWEQERFIRTLVAEVRYDGPSGTVTLGFRTEGIKELCQKAGE